MHLINLFIGKGLRTKLTFEGVRRLVGVGSGGISELLHLHAESPILTSVLNRLWRMMFGDVNVHIIFATKCCWTETALVRLLPSMGS